MLHSTSGIVLNTVKYSETSLIVKIYTSNFGLQSYMINGVRSKKSNKKARLFQPLALVDMIVSNSTKGNLQRISEITPLHPYTEIPFDMVKSSIVIFLNEILYKSLNEEHADADLFEFIKSSLLVLDLKHDNCANFHVYFMLQLSRYLGFYPEGKCSKETPLFDLREGRFIKSIPSHFDYLTAKASILLYHVIGSSYDSIHQIQIGNSERKALLASVILFYRLHIASFPEIKSQKVLEEVVG